MLLLFNGLLKTLHIFYSVQYKYIIWFLGGWKFAVVLGDGQIANLHNYFCNFEKNMLNSSRVSNLVIVV